MARNCHYNQRVAAERASQEEQDDIAADTVRLEVPDIVAWFEPIRNSGGEWRHA